MNPLADLGRRTLGAFESPSVPEDSGLQPDCSVVLGTSRRALVMSGGLTVLLTLASISPDLNLALMALIVYQEAR